MISLYLSVNLCLALAYWLARPCRDLRLVRIVCALSILVPLVLATLPESLVSAAPPREFFDRLAEPAQGTAYPPAPAPALVPAREVPSQPIPWGLFLGLGTALSLLRFLGRWMALGRLLRGTLRLHAIGRVRVAVSDEIEIPFSVRRLATSWVVLPATLAARPEDFRIALRHEVQHHRQGDTLWMVALELLVAFCFWNPFSRLWRSLCAELQEISCDEALVGGRGIAPQEYIRCLLRVAEAALVRRELVGATGIESFLKRRIQMLPQHTRPQRRAPSRIAGLVLGTLTVALAYGSESLLRENAEKRIDPRLQKIAEDAIAQAMAKHAADDGFAVLTDLEGHVLAEVRPGRALRPASVIKPLVLAAAIDRGVAKSGETFSCEEGTYKGYTDWKAFHRLTAADAIAHSSNICSIKIGERLGSEAIVGSLRSFGLPAAGSEVGLLTNGSAFAATPLQVVAAYGAIANGGRLKGRRILKESTAAEMREVLFGVVTYGTALEAASTRYTFAGKTGTAQDPTVPKSRSGDPANVASFAGFAPALSPKLVLYVGLIRPTDGDGKVHGSRHAAPIFREIIEKALPILGTDPDKK